MSNAQAVAFISFGLISISTPVPGVTATQKAWLRTYAANSSVNGIQLATIGNVATDGRAIISEMTLDEILAAGGTAEQGGYNVQMIAVDFSSDPEKFMAAAIFGPTVAGVPSGLEVLNANLNNGIWYLQVGDFVSRET